MKNKIIIFFSTIISLFLFSCNDSNNCLKKLGGKKIVKENILGFYRVNLNSCFEIVFVDSSAYSIEIETYENIIPLIEINIKQGVLNLKNTYNCTWLKKEDLPKITIYAPRIDSVFVNEPCAVSSAGKLTYDKFIVEVQAKIFNCNLDLYCHLIWFHIVSSTGTFNLRGKTDWAFISNSGHGNLNADGLKCHTLDLAHLSDGYSKISAYEQLHLVTIKYGFVDLITDQCPTIIFDNNEDKDLFFTTNCL